MSCALQFVSIDLDSLKNFFAAGDAAVREAVAADGDKIFSGDEDDEEIQESRLIWKEIVNSLGGGSLGKYMAAQTPLGAVGETTDVVSKIKALAIRNIVRKYGQSADGVIHSSSAGEIFRAEPFTYLNQAALLGRINSFQLLERPLFNQIHYAVPGWGGLTRAELAGISSDTLAAAAADSGDSDVDGWVNGILTLVEEAKNRGLDLVTIYE